jgi:PAS domain S-box-containing protein
MRKRAATDKPSRLNHFKKTFPYLALAILLFLSVLVCQYYRSSAMAREERRYNDSVEAVVNDITERLDKHKMILRGGTGLFPASEEVTRAEWRGYYDYQRVSTLYPGIQRVTFSKIVQPWDLAQHIEEIRAEGFTDYTVWPAGERELYAPLIYLEPFDEGAREALGFDLFSEPVRQGALEQARDTGEAVISQMVVLASEETQGSRPGFLMVVPVYDKGDPMPDTVEKRRAGIYGYVIGAYTMTALIEGIFPEPSNTIAFAIYDGAEVSPATLMYGSRVFPDTIDEEHQPLFTSQKIVDLHDHQWTLAFETMPAFEAVADRNSHWAMLGAGLLISVLIFLYLKSLTTTSDRAQTLARKMTSDLRESEEQLKKITDNVTDAVVMCDKEGIVTYLSPRSHRVLGFSPEELLGKPFFAIVCEEDLPAAIQQFKHSLEVEEADSTEYRIATKDGSLVWVETRGELLYDKGQISGAVFVTRDITERKQAEIESLRQAYRAEALLKVSSRLNAELELDRVRNAICEETCSALHTQMAAFLSYDSNTRLFHLTNSSGLPEELARVFAALSRDDYDTLIKKVGKYGAIPDLAAVPELAYAQPLLSHNIRSFASAVIERDELPLGLVFTGNVGDASDLPEDATALLSGLADQAASAVTNARLLQETRASLRQVQALRNIDLAITGSLDLRVTFQVVLDEVTGMLNTDAAAILLLDPYSGTLRYEQWRGFHGKDLKSIILPQGKGYGGRAASERQTIHIADLSKVEPEPVQGPLLAKEGFAAYFAVPMIAKGTVKGVLEVYHRELVETSIDWLSFLETLAGQAAIAVDNAELFSRLERSSVDLLQAYDATIEGWAHALDLKDEETEGHSRRVTEMTVELARKMNIKDEELAHVRRGALLHDIGKMGIPDAILLKPGKLNDEEWEIMKKHPVYAYDMLAPVDYLRPALDIPYCHHEKWDGSGYPRGLKGKAIPLPARIFAVVDVYDALTSDRPYRKAWSKEKTLRLIKEESGSHFDPAVVEVFLNEIEGSS